MLPSQKKIKKDTSSAAASTSAKINTKNRERTVNLVFYPREITVTLHLNY